MSRRSQYNTVRLEALLKSLADDGIIEQEDVEKIRRNRELNNSTEVAESMSKSKALTSSKITNETKSEFHTARDAGNMQKQIDIIWSVLTGDSQNKGNK